MISLLLYPDIRSVFYMRKELEHFNIGQALGGSQDWFMDPFMKLGGCGAVTACDTCIWLAKSQGAEWLYPFDLQNLSRAEFLHFGRVMKPYLRPRSGGINRLELYIRGFSSYLRGRAEVWRQEQGGSIRMLRMSGFSGSRPAEEAWNAVTKQIDAGFPIPILILRHKEAELKDFVWHWFLLIGYSGEEEENVVPKGAASGRYVKAVTYGEWAWVDFDRLWDTGYEQKGGLILYRWDV